MMIFDDNDLENVLHRGFNLSEEFPIRWVILRKTLDSIANPKISTTLFVIAHHITIDGVSNVLDFEYVVSDVLEQTSMSLLSSAIIKGLESGSEDGPAMIDKGMKTYAHFIEEQVSQKPNTAIAAYQ